MEFVFVINLWEREARREAAWAGTAIQLMDSYGISTRIWFPLFTQFSQHYLRIFLHAVMFVTNTTLTKTATKS